MTTGADGEKVLFYEGRYYMFSNFSSFQIFWEAKWWATSEHVYQAGKFVDPKIIRKISLARSAHDAKQIAKNNATNRRPEWSDAYKLALMEEILREKLRQHQYIQKALDQTGEMEMVEDSPRDPFWGRGPDWRGHNHLGKIWMKLREEMRKKAQGLG